MEKLQPAGPGDKTEPVRDAERGLAGHRHMPALCQVQTMYLQSASFDATQAIVLKPVNCECTSFFDFISLGTCEDF